MTHPVYTTEQLDGFKRNLLWTICKRMKLKCYPSAQQCREAIAAAQPQLAAPVKEISEQAKAQDELEAHLEQQCQAVAPETCATCPHFQTWGESGGRGYCPLRDRVVRAQHVKVDECWHLEAIEREFVQAKPAPANNMEVLPPAEIAHDPMSESAPPVIALSAFLAHTTQPVPLVSRACWDGCNILTGAYWNNDWRETMSVKVTINWQGGTYQRHDTYADGSHAHTWGNMAGEPLSCIEFDFVRLPIDPAIVASRAAVRRFRAMEAVQIISTQQAGVVERLTLESVIVRLPGGALRECHPDDLRHVTPPWQDTRWNDVNPAIIDLLKGYNPSQNVLDAHKKELVRAVRNNRRR